MGDDLDLEAAFRQWLATQPRAVPESSKGVLERAERRLIGSIKHEEPRARLIANAERVRRAQLGCLKARDLAAALPTDVDDEGRRRYRDNIAAATSAWKTTPADKIIELYAKKVREAP